MLRRSLVAGSLALAALLPAAAPAQCVRKGHKNTYFGATK